MASRTARQKKAARLIARAMNKVAGRRAVDSEKFRTNLRAVMRRTIDEEFIDVTPEDRKRFQTQYTLVGLSGQVGQRKARARWIFVRDVIARNRKGEVLRDKRGMVKTRALWRNPKGQYARDENKRRSAAVTANRTQIRLLAEASGLSDAVVRKAWKELGPDVEEILREVSQGDSPETKDD